MSITLIIICGFILCYLRLRRRKRKRKESENTHQNLRLLNLDISNNENTNTSTSEKKMGGQKKILDLPMFSFSSISAATDNFSVKNKLGEGGFGSVYKANLLNGQLVAVKRLSKNSGQGLEEFRNETILISKLQHRNLVRLLGCCIEQDEKILIYEYMPNKSLDSFLFDTNKRELLNWNSRVQIIEGIAQGILYLHQYSRLRIVHRDLKASNILLDGDMNPKISDFGMARLFGRNELQAKTNRIIGTYGYMSPEYALEGRFSIKSDIFAFGVMLLEILSGRKNTDFHRMDCLTLLGFAWKLWENNRVLELMDPILEIPSSSSMPLRYITVGLLCVQESPADRPAMLDIVAMFSSEHTPLVSPKRPAFTVGEPISSATSGSGDAENYSINDFTVSAMEAR